MAKARCVALYGAGVLFEEYSIEEIERREKERRHKIKPFN